MDLINWLHTNLPSPLMFSWGPINIYWYGFLYLVAIVLGYFFVRWQLRIMARAASGSLATVSVRLLNSLPDFSFGLIISGLLGARIYHVLNEWPYYLAAPQEIVAVWHGGLAIHGAIIGGAIFLWLYSDYLDRQSKQLSPTNKPNRGQIFLSLADLVTPALLLGQAIGRWGNYFNQELFGYPTEATWGIPISLTLRPSEFINHSYFQPTFLYESVWSLAGFILIYFLFFKKERTRPAGLVMGTYLIWTGLGRFFMELIRVDLPPIIFGVRLPIIVSVIWLLIGLGLLWQATHKSKEGV